MFPAGPGSEAINATLLSFGWHGIEPAGPVETGLDGGSQQDDQQLQSSDMSRPLFGISLPSRAQNRRRAGNNRRPKSASVDTTGHLVLHDATGQDVAASAEIPSGNSGRSLQGRTDLRQQLSTHFAGRKRLIHFDLYEPYRRIGLKLSDQIHIGRNDRADHEVASA